MSAAAGDELVPDVVERAQPERETALSLHEMSVERRIRPAVLDGHCGCQVGEPTSPAVAILMALPVPSALTMKRADGGQSQPPGAAANAIRSLPGDHDSVAACAQGEAHGVVARSGPGVDALTLFADLHGGVLLAADAVPRASESV